MNGYLYTLHCHLHNNLAHGNGRVGRVDARLVRFVREDDHEVASGHEEIVFGFSFEAGDVFFWVIGFRDGQIGEVGKTHFFFARGNELDVDVVFVGFEAAGFVCFVFLHECVDFAASDFVATWGEGGCCGVGQKLQRLGEARVGGGVKCVE